MMGVQSAIIRLPTPSTTTLIELDQPTNETVIKSSILNVLSTRLSNLFALKEYAKNVTMHETTGTNGSVERFEVVKTVIIDRQPNKSVDHVKLKLKPKTPLLIHNLQNAVVKTDFIGKSLSCQKERERKIDKETN